MSTNELIRRVQAGEVAIVDMEISEHCHKWWENNKYTNAAADWVWETDHIAGVYWVYKRLEGLR